MPDESHTLQTHINLDSIWQNQLAFMPPYSSFDELKAVISILSKKTPLVCVHEIETLKAQLVCALEQKRFILQMGDCAESFSSNSADELLAFIQMFDMIKAEIASKLAIPVITVGRIAGQYAKPRSDDSEMQDGITLHPFRGDLINSTSFSASSRESNPRNLLLGYHAAKKTIETLHIINSQHDSKSKNENTLYTSHESLLLAYDASLTRKMNGGVYNLSTHFPWLGTRTAIQSKAHTEYFEMINNPIAIKVNPNMDIDDLVKLIKRLNPRDIPGRVTIILRLGVSKESSRFLANLLKLLAGMKHHIIWMCDPMHGNTHKLNGLKIRIIEDMLNEMIMTTQILKQAGTHLSGLHFEATANRIHECFWRNELDTLHTLSHYTSLMDPRIQSSQLHDLLIQYFNKTHP